MAAAGELQAEPGSEPLAPFEIPHSSAMYIGRAAERRKAGRLRHELAREAPRDNVKRLQRELTTAVDDEIQYIRELQRRKNRKPLDFEQFRRAARALRELSTIPDELRLPRTPGQPDNGRGLDGATATDSLAGRILAASDASVSPSVRARASTPESTDGRIYVGAEPIAHDAHDDSEQQREQQREACQPHRASLGAR